MFSKNIFNLNNLIPIVFCCLVLVGIFCVGYVFATSNLIYGQSYVALGLTVSSNGSVNPGNGLVNGQYYSLGSVTNSNAAALNLMDDHTTSFHSFKDQSIYKEGSTYYMFYNWISDGSSPAYLGNIGYATSTDLVNWTDMSPNSPMIPNGCGWGQASGATCGSATGETAAPAVYKFGSTYFMFFSGGSSTGYYYSTAGSIPTIYTGVASTGWTWGDYLKGTNSAHLGGYDPSVMQVGTNYYLALADDSNKIIDLYVSTIPTSNPSGGWNSWAYVKSIPNTSFNQPLEAPDLEQDPSSGNFIMDYGVDDSTNDQRIGMAESSTINGTYQNIGQHGMIFLDFPNPPASLYATGGLLHGQTPGRGSISHPYLYYNSSDSSWYLFVCVAPETGLGNKYQSIIVYKSSDLINWTSTKTDSSLISGATNYVYVNSSGNLMHSLDLPGGLWDENIAGQGKEKNGGPVDGDGYLFLGTVNGSTAKSCSDSSLQCFSSILSSFDLTSPANNSYIKNPVQTFTWQASSSNFSPVTYQLYVNNELVKSGISDTSTTYTLTGGSGNYTWYVKAVFDTQTLASTSVFNLYYYNGYICYQGSATVANQDGPSTDEGSNCGGNSLNYTGSYDASNGSWDTSAYGLTTDMYDGNWTTGNAGDGSDTDNYLNIIYKKPTGASGGSWQVKDDTGTYYLSIPSNCWGYSSSQLNLRADSVAPGQNFNCLNQDTQIFTSKGQKAIKDVQKGDLVYSYNAITKKTELKPVEAIGSRSITELGSKYYYITTNKGNLIKVTYNHEFYANGQYIMAENLKVGDWLLDENLQKEKIVGIKIVKNTTDKVWDLEVQDDHNFFAGNVLVHNFDFTSGQPGNGSGVAWQCQSSGGWVDLQDNESSSLSDGGEIFEEAMNWYIADTIAPSGVNINYTSDVYASASIPLAVTGSDSGSGINAFSALIKRDHAPIANGACGSFMGTFSDITSSLSGSYPNFTDTTVSQGNCYQYKYLVSDYAGNQASYTSSNVAEVIGSPPTSVSASTNNAGSIVSVTFSKTMADPSAYYSEFSVNNGSSDAVTAAALHAGDNTKIDLTLQTPITNNQIVTVGYAAGSVISGDAGVLATFSGQSVTNNVLSSDTTLSSTVKGQTVTNFGTPSASIGSATGGTVTITAAEASDISNAGSYITLISANDSDATVNKVVKYPSGNSSYATSFATDAAYTTAPIADGDFFIIKVTASDGTISYYKITVTVTPAPIIVSSSSGGNGLLWLMQQNNNASAASIQAQIQKLQGALQAMLAQNGAGQNSSADVFTKNLKLGDVDLEVKLLQQFLNTHGFTVSASGAGSLGKETTKFGYATKAAVIKFQQAYASEILAPAGFKKGTGMVAGYTRAELNKLDK